MMKHQYGNMWGVYDGKNPFLFTANSTLNNKGELVMGRGMARQVKFRFPHVPEFFGESISLANQEFKSYYILLHPSTMIAALQVKRNFRDPADLNLIKTSLRYLQTWALNTPSYQFNINYPGIGNGGLSVAEVEPLLEGLPDNVTVWRWKEP